MKIGIVTIWNCSDNYGGMLQTFALQRYLREQGQDAFIIRFYDRGSFKHRAKKLVKNILNFMHLYKQKQKIKLRRFDKFREKNIALSSHIYYSLKEIQRAYPEADVYITGSDQVWARDLKNNFERIYYLNFGKTVTRRISYAASFGFSIFPCGDKKLYYELLYKFEKVSVREKLGIDFCKDCGIDALRCVDSTLLLPAKVYIDIMSPRKHFCDYAYFYTVNVSNPEEIYWGKLHDYYKSIGLESIITTASGYVTAKEIFECATYDYASVEEWLANIYYARVVVTASFHGVVFSILMHKDFIYLPLPGKLESGNDRISDLLYSSGLIERTAHDYEEAKRISNKHIDYEHIDDEEIKNLIIAI